jgi:hypothetical protein
MQADGKNTHSNSSENSPHQEGGVAAKLEHLLMEDAFVQIYLYVHDQVWLMMNGVVGM